MASLFRAAFPSATLIDASGNLTPAWRGFFQSLYARTGGSNGVSSDTSQLEAELEAERQARIAGDQAAANGLAAEIAARQQGDSNEAAARHSEVLSEAAARKAADTAETNARIAADALLVPKAELCSLWAACDLSFLPTADPGLGQPWLNSGVVTVGAPVGVTFNLGLEDGTGHWALQDGTGVWIWG